MSRRPSIIMSARSARAIANRKAKAREVSPNVSLDAAYGIIERECEKRDRRWYGVRDDSGESVAQTLANRIVADAPSRKEARLWVLAAIEDGTFPERNPA